MAAAAIRLISSRLTLATRSPSYHFTPVSRLVAPSHARCRLPRRSFSVQSRLHESKKYTEEHEWIELSPDGKIGTIGITHYASKALGDVVYVELPTTDLQVAKGDTIGAVESVKSASDIMTPVSGRITETNGVLEEKPGTINKGPETEGWLARIELHDVAELEALMTKDRYDEFVEGEGGTEEEEEEKK